MINIRSIALATTAIIGMASPAHASLGAYQPVPTTADIATLCNTDQKCSGVAHVSVSAVTLGGIVGIGWYDWNPAGCGTPNSTSCIQPSGATKAFQLIGFAASGASGIPGLITNPVYGAVCKGPTETSGEQATDVAAIDAAIAATGTAVIPASLGCAVHNLIGSATVYGLPGALVFPQAGVGYGLSISASGGVLRDLKGNLNGEAATLFSNHGAIRNTIMENLYAYGNGGAGSAYFGVTGNDASNLNIAPILKNLTADVRGYGCCGTSAFFIDNVADAKISGTTCFDDIGWCLQTTNWSGTISDHRAERINYGYTISGTGTSRVFTVATALGGRCDVLDDGIPVGSNSAITAGYAVTGCDGSHTVITVTVPTNSPKGNASRAVELYVWKGAEGISIGPGSHNVTGTGISVRGSGDSGVVIYGTTSNDSPRNIVLHGVDVRDVANAGVAVDSGSPSLVLDDYNIANWGLGDISNKNSAIWSAWQYASKEFKLHVGKGLLDNRSGSGLYGVAVAGHAQIEDGSPLKQVLLGDTSLIDWSSGLGHALTRMYYLQADAAGGVYTPVKSIMFTGRPWHDYPAQPNLVLGSAKPVDDQWFTYTCTGGCALDNTISHVPGLGGSASLQARTIAAGASMVVNLAQEGSAVGFTANRIVCVDAYAHIGTGASSTTGPRITLKSATNPTTAIVQAVLQGTGLKHPSVCWSTDGLTGAGMTEIDFSSPASVGNTSYFSGPEIKTQEINF